MARMHSRKKGKSGSTKSLDKRSAPWVRYKPKEIEELVIKLSKQDMKPSKIGLILRDSYGIPDVKLLTKKRITEILEKNKIVYNLPEDISSLIKRQIEILKHLEDNHKDQTARRGLRLTESKINRLIKYYKKKGKLSNDWKYDKSKAKLLVGS
jgi:small subunit ribosomal protein S15